MIFVGADVHVRNSFLYATDEASRRLVHGRIDNVPGEPCRGRTADRSPKLTEAINEIRDASIGSEKVSPN